MEGIPAMHTADAPTPMAALARSSRPGSPARPGNAVARTLWRTFGAVLVVAGLVWGTYSIVTLLAHEERVETTTYPAADVTALDVRSSAGAVQVTTTTGNEVVVRAEISDGLRSTGESQRLVDGVLALRASCPNYGTTWCQVRYDVQVPADVAVTLDVDGGGVEVSGIEAPVTVEADNGSIRLADLAGPVVATTDNGSVDGIDLRAPTARADTDNGHVTLQFAVAPTTVEATSNNGDVDVVVPATGEAYQLTMGTDNGSQDGAIPIDSSSRRSITVRSDNGDVSARAAG